jgi:hypothetical protein
VVEVRVAGLPAVQVRRASRVELIRLTSAGRLECVRRRAGQYLVSPLSFQVVLCGPSLLYTD